MKINIARSMFSGKRLDAGSDKRIHANRMLVRMMKKLREAIIILNENDKKKAKVIRSMKGIRSHSRLSHILRFRAIELKNGDIL